MRVSLRVPVACVASWIAFVSIARAAETDDALKEAYGRAANEAPKAEEAPKVEAAKVEEKPAPKADPSSSEQKRSAADLARDLQTPSPGGAGKPRATIVDTADFQLALRGFGQFMAIPYVGKDALVAAGDVADFSGFRARRLQLGAEGRAGDHLSFGLWLDLVDTPVLLQARIAYTFIPELSIEAGVMRVPFSRNAIQSSAELSFAERPLAVNQLVPDRQPGASLYGVLLGGIASYRAGVFNGADPRRAGSGNDHPGLLIAGRAVISPLGPIAASGSEESFAGPRVEFGASILRDQGASYEGTARGADLAAQAWGITLSAEYVQDVRTPLSEPTLPSTIASEIERTGLIVQGSGFVWKHDVELAARWESVDDHVGLDDVGDVTGLAAGVHWYLAGPDLRLNLDYYHRTESALSADRQLANDAVVLGTQGRF